MRSRAGGDQRWPPQIIETRVERQEQRVTQLEELPERMDRLESQFVQLRTEMHDEFAAVREEIRAGDEETRREMRAGFSVLRVEIRTGDEETRRYMRMLFDEYVGRMKVIDEGKNGRT